MQNTIYNGVLMRRKKFDEEAQSGDTDLKTHFLHQFQRLDIADYAEDTET